jgi:hypothetical protein
MKFAVTLAVIAAFTAVYFVWIRPYLKSLPSFADLWHEEDDVLTAIKVWIDGRKTILTGIWGEVIGLAPDMLQIVSGVDLKTALNLPDNWALWVSGIAVPMLMLIFRSKTTA